MPVSMSFPILGIWTANSSDPIRYCSIAVLVGRPVPRVAPAAAWMRSAMDAGARRWQCG